MAMKEMNKADMISRGYVTHTKQEKDIMTTVCLCIRHNSSSNYMI
mgnify:CR=1 FL=1